MITNSSKVGQSIIKKKLFYIVVSCFVFLDRCSVLVVQNLYAPYALKHYEENTLVVIIILTAIFDLSEDNPNIISDIFVTIRFTKRAQLFSSPVSLLPPW